MKREEIIKVYEAGPEDVVELTESLLERIKQLEDQVNKNSRNSSNPPSTDGFKKPQPKSLREKDKRPVGGQMGHPGHTLIMTEQPDHVIVHRVVTCSCGHDLEHVEATRQERRQVWDIPPLKMEVTEHRAKLRYARFAGISTRLNFLAM